MAKNKDNTEALAAAAAAEAAAQEAPDGGLSPDVPKEFGDAFEEFADATQSTDGSDFGSGGGAEEAGSPDGGAGGDQAKSEQADLKETAESDDGKSGAEGDSGGDEDDSEQGSEGDSEQGSEGTDETEGSDKADDPFSGAELTPEQDQALKKLRHENSSHRGRAAADTRRIDSLSGELSRAREAGADASALPEGDGDPTKVFDSDEWKFAEKEVPQIAGPLKAVVTDLQKTVASQARQLSAFSDEQRADVFATNAEYVDQAHEGWEGDLRTEEFATWFNQQPSHVQEGFRRNAKNIVDRVEAVELIDRFKASEFFTTPASAESDKAERASAPAEGTGKIARKRQAQLKGNAAVRNRGPGTTSGPPEDFDGAFEHFSGQADKRAAQG